MSLEGKTASVAGATRGAGLLADEVKRLVDRIGAERGRLDVLVNGIWAARLSRNGTSLSGSMISGTGCACSVSGCMRIGTRRSIRP